MIIPAGSVRLDQFDTGYRYNRDSFLLADFFRAGGVRSVADLCAGVGAVSVLIGSQNPRIEFTAVDIQPGLARRALQNARGSGLEKFHAVAGDVMAAPDFFKAAAFDAIVSNPPYRKAGTGRINPDPDKAIARHELKMTLDGLVRAASQLLARGGSLTIVMIYERLAEYRALLGTYGFCESRFREVRSFEEGEPHLFLSEGLRGAEGALSISPPLVLKSRHGGDSDEFKEIVARYAG